MQNIGKLKLYKERKWFRLPKIDILGRRGGKERRERKGEIRRGKSRKRKQKKAHFSFRAQIEIERWGWINRKSG